MYLRCKGIVLVVHDLLVGFGCAGAIRVAVVYCATVERGAYEVVARATARNKDLLVVISLVVD